MTFKRGDVIAFIWGLPEYGIETGDMGVVEYSNRYPVESYDVIYRDTYDNLSTQYTIRGNYGPNIMKKIGEL